jgi:hypothetical protein
MRTARRCAAAVGIVLSVVAPGAGWAESPESLRYLERQAERGVEREVWRGEADRRQERLERLERQRTDEIRGLRGDLEDRAGRERLRRLLEEREK